MLSPRSSDGPHRDCPGRLLVMAHFILPSLSLCFTTDPQTHYYVVAMVKKGTDFQLNQLQGKKSCHAGLGWSAGWYVPLSILLPSGSRETGETSCPGWSKWIVLGLHNMSVICLGAVKRTQQKQLQEGRAYWGSESEGTVLPGGNSWQEDVCVYDDSKSS